MSQRPKKLIVAETVVTASTFKLEDRPSQQPQTEEKVTKEEKLIQLATYLNNKAHEQQQSGFVGAESANEIMSNYKGSLKIKEHVFGHNSLPAAKTLANIGTLHFVLGEYEMACQTLQTALQTMEYHSSSQSSLQDSAIATVIFNLAKAELARGNAKESLTYLNRCLDIRWALFGPHDKRVTRVLHRIAEVELMGKMPTKEEEEEKETSSSDPFQTIHSEVQQAIQFVDNVQETMAAEIEQILVCEEVVWQI